MLGNPKDKSDSTEKSGIYKIDCENCRMYYIGQTSRAARVRFEEHISKFRRRQYDSSAVAAHMHFNEHTSDINNLTLLEPVSDTRKLDFLETSYINSVDPDLLLNREGGALQ